MALPVGSIVMWFDSISNRPGGWEQCNGQNGTPDLRGKFVIGVASDTEVGQEYGTASHSHVNPATQVDGAHVHDVTGKLNPGASKVQVSDIGSGTTVGDPDHEHVIDFDLPSSGTHAHTTSSTNTATNLPPYVQIHYIMKVQ